VNIRDQIPYCQIDLTNNCNLTCSFCRQSLVKDLPDSMSADRWSEVISQLADMGCTSLTLAGGEPLMHKDFFKVFDFATSKIEKVQIMTNGTLITKKIAQRLVKASSIQISLDAFNPDLHDKIRGKTGLWEKAVRGLKLSVESGIFTNARITLFQDNLQEALPLLDFVHSIGVNAFAVRRVIPSGKGGSVNLISSTELRDVLRAIDARAKEIGIKTDFGDPFPNILLGKVQPVLDETKSVGGCSMGIDTFYVTQDGTVLLCAYLPIYCGDVNKDSVKSIWQNSKAFSVARALRSNLKGKCGGCKFNFKCGGCRAVAYYQTGDICGEDAGCWQGL